MTIPSELSDGISLSNQVLQGIEDLVGGKIASEDLPRFKDELVQSARVLAVSAAIGEALARGDSWRAVLQACAEVLVKHLDAALVRVWTLGTGKDVLERQVCVGECSCTDKATVQVALGESKIGEIARSRRPYMTNTLAAESHLADDDDWLVPPGLVAFAAYPLLADNRLVGVIELFFRNQLAEYSFRALGSVFENMASGIEHSFQQQTNSLLAAMVETADDAVFSRDIEGKILTWNEGAELIFGYTSAEAVGRSILDLIPPEYHEEYHAIGRTVLSGQRVVHQDTVRLRKDGKRIDVSNTCSPIFASDGAIIGASVIARDITFQKRAIKALGASEAKYRNLFENSSDLIQSLKPDGKFVFANNAWYKTLGYNAHELDDLEPAGILHPDSLSLYEAALQEVISGCSVAQIEVQFVTKEGEVIDVEGHITPELVDGKVIALTGIFRNMTERKRSEERLRSVIEAAASGMVMVDRNGKIVLVNSQIEKLFGYSREELLGNSIEILVPDEVRPRHHLLRDKFFAQHKARVIGVDPNTTLFGQRKDGTLIPAEIGLNPINLGGQNFVLASINDITQRKEVEMRMAEFYSMVSHELRSPLASIRGALGLIDGGRAGMIPDKAKHLVQIASTSTDRLIRLINDILDLRKIEAGKLDLRRESIDLSRAVDITLDGLKGLAYELSVTLSHAKAQVPPVWADLDRLVQVITNLTSNAIKFSPKGGAIVVSYKLVDGDRARVTVTDQGPGIPENQLHKLFGKFQQLDSSDRRPKEGTGLGLAISKAIVEEHGGSIGVESVVGEGTTFWFELPLAPVQKELPPVVEDRKPTVLVVDDDDNLCGVLAMLISAEGYAFKRASNLRDAKAMLAQEIPQVVILEVQLPDGNGLEFLQTLEELKVGDLPVIVLSKSEAGAKSFAQPMLIDWLPKPFDQARLVKVLRKAVREPGCARVLIVEDDPAITGVLTSLLADLEITCKEATDGEQALALVQSYKPDLIILDVGLPRLDGFELVAKLRARPSGKIPLIVYTGRDLSGEEKERLTLGITRHMMKASASREEFLLTVGNLLNGVLAAEADKEQTRAE